MSSQEQWYIQQGGEHLGPYNLAQVYELISSGQVSDKAWFGHEDLWLDLEMLQEDWPDPGSVGPSPAILPAIPPAEESFSLSPSDQPGMYYSSSPDIDEANINSIDDDVPIIERDSILILGRRRAGKTIYLATLYAMLWKSLDGITIKAMSGRDHKMLMSIADQLARREWPEATLGTRQMVFELDDHGRKYPLVAFDYSGEDFRRAFVDEETESDEVKKLLNYVDRAAAVILLIDPMVAVNGKHEEVVDDDFGMVQAVQRVRGWHGGEHVPVVLVLTKVDRNSNVIRSCGSAKEFVLRHYPALARTLKRIAIFKVAAVQEARDSGGRVLPRKDSVPINIEKPLQYCLQQLRKRESIREKEDARQAAEAARRAYEGAQVIAEAHANRRFWILMSGFIILCLCGLAVFYMVLIN